MPKTTDDPALLAALRRLARGSRSPFRASNLDLAAASGLSLRRLARSLDRLESAGLIRRLGRGRGRAIEVAVGMPGPLRGGV